MQNVLFQLRRTLKKYDWFTLSLWILLCMGIVVRAMKLPLMEFKGDEFHFMVQSFLHPFALGEIRAIDHFFIPHPPSFAYILALPTSLTVNPIAITACIVWLNLVALWLFYGFCKRLFTKEVALISVGLLASMPWAVLFSRKIWNPDIVFFCQMLFLVSLESLVRSYKPWKLYLCVVLLALFLQAHLLSLFSIIPVMIVLYIAQLPISRVHFIRASVLFLALFLPYLSYVFGHEGAPSSSPETLSFMTLNTTVIAHNLTWWMNTSTGLGFEYLLGESGYVSFLSMYNLKWAPFIFGLYACIAGGALLWILSKMLKETLWYKKDSYPVSLLILLFLVLWAVMLPCLLIAMHKMSPPHYWVSVMIILPICFGIMMHTVVRNTSIFLGNFLKIFTLVVMGTQVLFMLSFYGFIENHHEEIQGDYGIPYQFEQKEWEKRIENAARDM